MEMGNPVAGCGTRKPSAEDWRLRFQGASLTYVFMKCDRKMPLSRPFIGYP
ncbi:hypothetical protein P408_03845 [Brucella abortus S99]|nr:hypothetical protein P408_03845 [Brucella abortus S99]